MKNILTFILAIGSLISVFAQNQTIKGSVIDKQAEISLVGASVELLDNNDLSFIKGTVTDADGTFSIPEVNPGRHTLRVSYIGYLT
ncbi:MAG TPA: carboxypeptidase regulatory-like domain-containing protein, partial [Saprospiraceae bacterium]|nr:carboxypeptidase regulatory-like domain-containing protein [Saprospiraceae bacterium]